MDWKNHNSCSFWAENFGRSLDGQGGQQGGVKYSIQSFKWNPTACAKTHKLRNSKKARNTSSNHLRQRLMRLLLAANNQPTRANEIIQSYLKAATNMHPACPKKKENHHKTACSDGPNSGKASQNRLRSNTLPVATSHKASLKPKRSASPTLIQKWT